MNCRFCGNKLTHEFIDLGNSPPANSFLTLEQLNEPEVFYPLKLFVCDKCFLVQIDEYKKATEIFNKEYSYFSSFSKTWLAHAHSYTKEMIKRFQINSNHQIIEIASNDGYLLQYFKEKNIPVLGIEPSESVAVAARGKGIETRTEYFGTSLAKKLSESNSSADLLIGNNVLAHVPNINDFVAGLKIGLKSSGIITMEFPHLVQLIDNNQFDTIYHEHFSYFSFYTVILILKKHGLTIFDVAEIPTHGGSLRIFAKHSENSNTPISDNVNALLEKEKKKGILNIAFYKSFQKKTDTIKYDLLKFLTTKKIKNKKIAGYGAAAKGNTLLNYCGIKKDMISFVVDVSPHKQEKFLPGSHIPVVNETEIRKSKPDLIIILPWNIKEEIMQQLSYIRKWSGRFVIPIPNLQVL